MILAPQDEQIWRGTAYASLSDAERAGKTHEFILLTGEAPLLFHEGRGFAWVSAALLYSVK